MLKESGLGDRSVGCVLNPIQRCTSVFEVFMSSSFVVEIPRIKDGGYLCSPTCRYPTLQGVLLYLRGQKP